MPERPKGTRPVVLTDPTVLVRRANHRLVMMRDKTEVAAIPLDDIAHVAVHGPVTLTGAALAGLLDAGIDVTLYSSAGFYRGSITSAQSRNVYLLLAQVDAWRRDERRLAFARSLLAGKIAGQRALLQRQARDRASTRCRTAAEHLRRLEQAALEETDVDAVRGVEGAAAARYFDAFGDMLSAGWRWEGRRHRPAPDPVNAALSYGYALATGEVVRALVQHGFDTRVGLVHGLRYGRESLALDVVEEFRAPMVDRFVLRTLNRREVSPDDFEPYDDGSVRFTVAGRRRFLEAWAGLLEGPAAALPNERRVAGDAERLGSLRLGPRAAGAEGASTGPDGAFTADDGPEPRWRRRIEVQVLRLRRFLMKGEDYVPLTRTVRDGAPREAAAPTDDEATDSDDDEATDLDDADGTFDPG
jgi:CRISPR-associated protein Cas1